MENNLQQILNELGKGSDPRPMDISKEKFEENFERIFGKKNKTDNKSEEQKDG